MLEVLIHCDAFLSVTAWLEGGPSTVASSAVAASVVAASAVAASAVAASAPGAPGVARRSLLPCTTVVIYFFPSVAAMLPLVRDFGPTFLAASISRFSQWCRRQRRL